MSLAPTRWLIELPASAFPEPRFLHVFDDGEMDCAADRTRALRFASAEDASRFACEHRIPSFAVSEHLAVDLVAAVDREFDGDA